MSEMFARPVPRLKHVLRMYISHSFETTHEKIRGTLAADAGSKFVLKISGHLLNQTFDQQYLKKFTSFFERIEVSVDTSVYSQYGCIAWKKQQTQDYDGIEIKRLGSLETDV